MNQTSAQPQSAPALSDLARTYAAQALPGLFQSYPMVFRTQAGLRVAIFFYPAAVGKPEDGFEVRPPTYTVTLNAISGRLEEIRACAPIEFHLDHPTDKPLGKYLSPAHRANAEFLTRQAKWYQAYDGLISAFQEAAHRPTRPDAALAAEFLDLFPQVTEAPLAPYYRAVGKEFFDWLAQAKTR